MVQLTFALEGGRTINADDLDHLDEALSLDPVEKAMLLALRNHVRRRFDNLSCPIHGQYAIVVASGTSADRLTFRVEGCCEQFVNEGRATLAATSSLELSMTDVKWGSSRGPLSST
jgi:hypothetical protein